MSIVAEFLPPELIIEIFNYLTVSDITNICLTSKDYNILSREANKFSPRKIRIINLSFTKDPDETIKTLLSLYPNISKLCYCDRNYKNINSAHQKLTVLIRLFGNKSKIISSLQSLEINFENDIDCEQFLTNLNNLSSLSISNSVSLTDLSIICISNLTKLTLLDLSYCDNITDNGINYIKLLTNLESLDLSFCSEITDLSLLYISTITTITFLKLIQTLNNITDNGISNLQLLIKLKSLSLCYFPSITDLSLSYIKNILTITRLDLKFCYKITDDGINYLKLLTNLNSLNINSCNKITDISLSYISILTTISFLNFSHCNNITDNGILNIKLLISLNSLNLSFCDEITDLSLSYISTILI
jgi:hypothetical protein